MHVVKYEDADKDTWNNASNGHQLFQGRDAIANVSASTLLWCMFHTSAYFSTYWLFLIGRYVVLHCAVAPFWQARPIQEGLSLFALLDSFMFLCFYIRDSADPQYATE